MEVEEALDRDLSLQRASQSALGRLRKRIAQLTLSNQHIESRKVIVNGILQDLDIFQEDPQLLDPILNHILSPVLSRYLELIQSPEINETNSSACLLAAGLSKIICSFCKVRGRKVVSRFLSNGPRYLHSLFSTLHRLEGGGGNDSTVADWEQHFVVLLWLSHLILTPFDLATFSETSDDETNYSGLKLPLTMPTIARDAVRASIDSMSSATSRRDVAASLLTRLLLRPDMLKLHLLDRTITWALDAIDNIDTADDIHRAASLLMLLNGIVSSASLLSIRTHIAPILSSTRKILDPEVDSYVALRDSAVSKRLAIKIERNVVVQLIQGLESDDDEVAQTANQVLVDDGTLEDAIDYFLRSLGNRDTQVRMAASKALALIALKLDHDMAQDIVDTVIESMAEDVLTTPKGKTLEAVDAERWHGLTLTLSHMLFRRTPSPQQVPRILDALYLALGFEQKSTSGGSIGGNVRDAANYGLWSLARRYSTEQLLNVQDTGTTSIIQQTADHLICAACLDPVANVRRGASAALQELIGRHPDTISSGIALVQAVDYLAVGLRSRSVIQVASQASELDSRYRMTLLRELQGWRGLRMPNQIERYHAATAVGLLVRGMRSSKSMQAYMNEISKVSGTLEPHMLEELEGFWLAQAAISNQMISRCNNIRLANSDADAEFSIAATGVLPNWLDFNSLIESRQDVLGMNDRKSKYVANGILHLLHAVASATDMRAAVTEEPKEHATLSEGSIDTINKALRVIDGDSPILESLFGNFTSAYCPGSQGHALQSTLLSALNNVGEASRIPGVPLALGRILGQLVQLPSDQDTGYGKILRGLCRIASNQVPIETRRIGLRSLGPAARGLAQKQGFPSEDDSKAFRAIADVAIVSLNDYTINERGDVGSLLRSEALRSLVGPIFNRPGAIDKNAQEMIYRSTLRLSVEKLDKVRLYAIKALSEITPNVRLRHLFRDAGTDLSSVSTYEHFLTVAELLHSDTMASESRPDARKIRSSVIEGFASSAGSGTSTTTPVARAALEDVLYELPLWPVSNDKTDESSILQITGTITSLIDENLANDRVLIPTLDLLSFLLDARIIQKLSDDDSPQAQEFKPRVLLSKVQKAHFKSSSVPKILAAVNAYRGLIEIPKIRHDVLVKLASMLSHPFSPVRMAVAEVMWTATNDETLLSRNWKAGVEVNRSYVARVKEKINKGELDMQTQA